jgi:methylmalonyl-CoA/ethylmalonyl-CoA epimerase
MGLSTEDRGCVDLGRGAIVPLREPRGGRSVLTDIDHVGIAVRDLDAAVDRYRSAFGLEAAHRETVESQGVEAVFLPVGGSAVELLAALSPDTAVGRFLDKRGEGIHHVAYRVADVDAALARLREDGVPLIDQAPRPGSRGTRIAFAHPSGFGGVLVELVELPR